MVRLGKDPEDTHESMQLNRYLDKYDRGKAKRHPGNNRLQHRKKK
ncbi:MAG TPA: hypothetical protein VD735_01860 [Candidatus Saccharimonadales bacterium]|nr:hypothetical protein [Candidatus Saccharimonadales bacterium]